MKVVQINALGATLSTGRTTRQMHEIFQNKGIESYIVCPAPLDCNDVFTFNDRVGLRMNTLITMITGLEGYHSSLRTVKLLRFLDDIKPDIVHLRVLHGKGINMLMLFKYLARRDIATVITLHDLWYLTGRCNYYTAVGCNRWISGCYQCPSTGNVGHKVAFDRTEKMWKDKMDCLLKIPRLAIVGVSDWVTNEANRSVLKSHARIKRIYNWIDLGVFQPRDACELRNKMGLTDATVVLGVAASWSLNDRKGLSYYISLSEILPTNYRIVLVGKMGKEVELPEKIISLPRTSDQFELSQLYSLADVYLNLSVEETFGKVSAEALSCGTPIVAIDSTANKELVPVECGIVLDSLDINQMKEALLRICAIKKEYYVPKCRKFAQDNFDMQSNVQEYIELYHELGK